VEMPVLLAESDHVDAFSTSFSLGGRAKTLDYQTQCRCLLIGQPPHPIIAVAIGQDQYPAWYVVAKRCRPLVVRINDGLTGSGRMEGADLTVAALVLYLFVSLRVRHGFLLECRLW
jgi:hypothetical protein